MIPRHLTAQELASRLGVSESWVYAHAISGDLPSVMLGGLRRFPEDEIADWLKAQGGAQMADVRQLRSVSG